MASALSRFWKRFRKVADEQNEVLFDHKPNKPWESNRHVGERPRKFAHFVYHIYRDHADVSLEVHVRKGDVAETRRIYEHLRARRADIESSFGDSLEWSPSPKSDVARVRFRLHGGGYEDESRWNEIHHNMISEMRRLQDAFKIAVDTVPFPAVEEAPRVRRAA